MTLDLQVVLIAAAAVFLRIIIELPAYYPKVVRLHKSSEPQKKR